MMQQSLLVSVIIPVYNGAKYIDETLRYLLKQSYQKLEIIVVDDGSTDDTGEVVLRHKSFDGRIQHIRQEREGVSSARNKGLSVATGEYVVFFDADDLCDENFIKARVSALQCACDIGYSCGDVVAFTDSQSNVKYIEHGIESQVAEKILLYWKGYSTVPSNYMYRRALLQKHNIRFDRRLWSTADRLFLLEVGKVAQGVYVQQSPLYYRLHSESMSARLTKSFISDNEMFWNVAKQKGLIPPDLQEYAQMVHYRMIGRSYAKLLNVRAIKWLLKGVKDYGFNFIRFFIQSQIQTNWFNKSK